MFMDELYFLNDGSYDIDSGAYCGIVPKVLWSKYFNDNDNKIRNTTNIPFLKINNKNILIDSGMGNNFSERFIKNFRPEKNHDVENQLRDYGVKNIDLIIQSHMHFDHSGHTFSKNNIFKKTEIILQKRELNAFRKPNDFTRGSYIKNRMNKKMILVDGSRRISGNINVIFTSGHTEGHEVILFEINSKKYLYGGDLFPSAFHIKPYYLTALDSYPLNSLKMKKKLLNKVIREKILMIFNHDDKNVLCEVYGTVEKPLINKLDMDKYY